jgi:hypothetical protein
MRLQPTLSRLRRGRSASEPSQGTPFYFLIQSAAVKQNQNFSAETKACSAQKGETDEFHEKILEKQTCATLPTFGFQSTHRGTFLSERARNLKNMDLPY